MSRHVNNGACPSCAEKIKTAHPTLAAFWETFQQAHKDAHISWAHRGEEDQNHAYKVGTSPLKWPESKHNKMPAEAIDAFRLTQSGGATWDRRWFAEVFGPAVRAAGLVWGGDFKRFKDMPHAELPD